MSDYTLPAVPDHPFANSLSERWSEMEEVAIGRYGQACAEHVRAPLLARIAELEALVEKECAHDAPLPPEYKVEEFLPGIWAWSVKGESEWVGDGSAYGWYEAAVVAAWRDHADTLARALDESTAAETSAIDERDRLRAELAAKAGEVEALRGFAQKVMRAWPDSDVDVGDLQDYAAEFGLLEGVEVSEPCGPACACSEQDDWPIDCYHRTALLTGSGPCVNPLAAEVEAHLAKAQSRGDNHWETLRSIRHIAKESGNLARIVQWVNDVGSGYTDTAENTLAAAIDERDRLRAELAQVSGYCETLTQRCVDDTAENGRLRAEVEALRADAERLEWLSLKWGGFRGDYASWVLRRGGTGDLSDIRSFVDAARKGEGVAGV